MKKEILGSFALVLVLGLASAAFGDGEPPPLDHDECSWSVLSATPMSSTNTGSTNCCCTIYQIQTLYWTRLLEVNSCTGLTQTVDTHPTYTCSAPVAPPGGGPSERDPLDCASNGEIPIWVHGLAACMFPGDTSCVAPDCIQG
jgi:hypothetical protein